MASPPPGYDAQPPPTYAPPVALPRWSQTPMDAQQQRQPSPPPAAMVAAAPEQPRQPQLAQQQQQLPPAENSSPPRLQQSTSPPQQAQQPVARPPQPMAAPQPAFKQDFLQLRGVVMGLQEQVDTVLQSSTGAMMRQVQSIVVKAEAAAAAAAAAEFVSAGGGDAGAAATIAQLQTRMAQMDAAHCAEVGKLQAQLSATEKMVGGSAAASAPAAARTQSSSSATGWEAIARAEQAEERLGVLTQLLPPEGVGVAMLTVGRSGQLVKRSISNKEGKKNWQKRWFKLGALARVAAGPAEGYSQIKFARATLAYMESSSSKKPKGFIQLNCNMAVAESSKDEKEGDPLMYGMEIGPLESGDSLFVRASSAAERDQWIAALRCVLGALDEPSSASGGRTSDLTSARAAAPSMSGAASDEIRRGGRRSVSPAAAGGGGGGGGGDGLSESLLQASAVSAAAAFTPGSGSGSPPEGATARQAQLAQMQQNAALTREAMNITREDSGSQYDALATQLEVRTVQLYAAASSHSCGRFSTVFLPCFLLLLTRCCLLFRRWASATARPTSRPWSRAAASTPPSRACSADPLQQQVGGRYTRVIVEYITISLVELVGQLVPRPHLRHHRLLPRLPPLLPPFRVLFLLVARQRHRQQDLQHVLRPDQHAVRRVPCAGVRQRDRRLVKDPAAPRLNKHLRRAVLQRHLRRERDPRQRHAHHHRGPLQVIR